jgi:hypothetical protein
MCKSRPDRVGIIAEGDSWFAYPRKWIAFGADINIVHHIAENIKNTDTANLLQLASNGDEAVDMMSGKQKKRLYKILKKNRAFIRLVLFSGGGNDIVGKNDMLPLLNHYQAGMSATQCIDQLRFSQKLEAIMLAYRNLVDLCADVVPDAKIVTHTYDIPQPQNRGGEFFWGRLKTKPWIYPYLVRREIPTELHYPIIEEMLGAFGSRLKALADEPICSGRILVVDTQGTLRPGHASDWLNEIHPTEAGFKRVTKDIYKVMEDLQPSLPAW